MNQPLGNSWACGTRCADAHNQNKTKQNNLATAADHHEHTHSTGASLSLTSSCNISYKHQESWQTTDQGHRWYMATALQVTGYWPESQLEVPLWVCFLLRPKGHVPWSKMQHHGIWSKLYPSWSPNAEALVGAICRKNTFMKDLVWRCMQNVDLTMALMLSPSCCTLNPNLTISPFWFSLAMSKHCELSLKFDKNTKI
jgi:hypothetical protein